MNADTLERRARHRAKAKLGWYTHAAVYLAVNLGLMLLSLSNGIIVGLRDVGILGFMSSTQTGQVRFILVGIGLMLLVIFRPQGIFGNKKELSFNV